MDKYNNSGIDLPRDANLHLLSNIEWWYCYSFLSGDKGSKFAIMASFFSFGEVPCFKGHNLIFSLIDLDNNVGTNIKPFWIESV